MMISDRTARVDALGRCCQLRDAPQGRWIGGGCVGLLRVGTVFLPSSPSIDPDAGVRPT